MANCPSCQNEIAEDFGLVTCAHCGAQVMLEFDGAAVPNPSAEPPLATANPLDASGDFPSDGDVYQSQDESTYSNDFAASELAPAGLATTKSEAPAELEPVVESPNLADMGEIADFGNSEESQGREGFLRYNLFIAGIDTADVRVHIAEALSDARFLWDAEQIMSEVKSGELKIAELTAVKAALLIQRLRSLPITIKWEQYAIHQV